MFQNTNGTKKSTTAFDEISHVNDYEVEIKMLHSSIAAQKQMYEGQILNLTRKLSQMQSTEESSTRLYSLFEKYRWYHSVQLFTLKLFIPGRTTTVRWSRRRTRSVLRKTGPAIECPRVFVLGALKLSRKSTNSTSSLVDPLKTWPLRIQCRLS